MAVPQEAHLGRGLGIDQPGDYVVNSDSANGMLMIVDDGEHAEIVFVEELEDIFLTGIGGDADQRFRLHFGHMLFRGGKEHASDGNSTGKIGHLIDKDDGVELLEVQILIAHPLENFFACGLFTDEDKLGIHHATGSGRIVGEQFANFVGFLIRHFVENFFGGLFGEVGKEVSRSVGSHFFDDVGSFFGVEFFDDLGGEPLIKFGEDGGSSLFVEGRDNSLPLGSGELFHHFGKIGGVQIFELFVGDAEFDAPERVGLDEINEFPKDGALGEFGLQAAHNAGGRETLKKTAHGAGKPNVNLGDAKFDVLVGAIFGEIDVVDANDFSAFGINDLLIEKILANGQP